MNSTDPNLQIFYKFCCSPTLLKSKQLNPLDPNEYISCDGHENYDAMKSIPNQDISLFLFNTNASVLDWFIGNKNDGLDIELARVLNVFFLDPLTKMNPSGTYLQLNPISHPYLKPYSEMVFPTNSVSIGTGSINLRSFYYLPDLLQIVESTTTSLNVKTTISGVRNWFSKFIDWLDTSSQGQYELTRMPNNHGSSIYLTFFLNSRCFHDRLRIDLSILSNILFFLP